MPELIHVIQDGETKHKRAVFRCECGKEFVAFTRNVATGHTQSCGCLRARSTSERSTKHGHRAKRTKAYVAWVNMKARCDKPTNRQYADYGGRGISYDPRWALFENFLADVGEPPRRNLTLDRIDNSKGYSKENCRWATRSQQGVNKRNNVFYTFNGQNKTLAEWARETGIGRVTLLKRIQAGVPVDVALTTKGFCAWHRKK